MTLLVDANTTKTKHYRRVVGGDPSKTTQQTRSLQIPVYRVHKSASAAARGDQHGEGPKPFGRVCSQQWAKRVCRPEIDCRASSIESSDHVIFGGASSPRSSSSNHAACSC